MSVEHVTGVTAPPVACIVLFGALAGLVILCLVVQGALFHGLPALLYFFPERIVHFLRPLLIFGIRFYGRLIDLCFEFLYFILNGLVLCLQFRDRVFDFIGTHNTRAVTPNK